MTYSQTTGATMSKPKITIVPPVEQDVFFQEHQFDEELGAGMNPIRWWQGSTSDAPKEPKAPKYGAKIKADRLKKAEKALEGHENKEEIMQILKRGL